MLVLELAATAGLAQAGYEGGYQRLFVRGHYRQLRFSTPTIGVPWGRGSRCFPEVARFRARVASAQARGDTVGNLMYSSDQTAAFGTDPDNVNLGASASAAAFASLAAGAVGVSSTGTYLDFNGSGGLTCGTARAYAQIVDGLTVYAPGASVNNPVDIGVTFTIDGVFRTCPLPTAIPVSPTWISLFLMSVPPLIATPSTTAARPLGRRRFRRHPASVAGQVTASRCARPVRSSSTDSMRSRRAWKSVGISAALDDYCGAGIGCDYYHTGSHQA